MTETSFILDPAFEGESVAICDLTLCHVRLLNDNRYPWLMLIPQRPGLADWDDLTPEDLITVSQEAQMASRVLKDLFQPTKTNMATLGNMVRQMHLHIIARFEGDAAWPGPVWGVGEHIFYTDEALAETVDRLYQAFKR